MEQHQPIITYNLGKKERLARYLIDETKLLTPLMLALLRLPFFALLAVSDIADKLYSGYITAVLAESRHLTDDM